MLAACRATALGSSRDGQGDVRTFAALVISNGAPDADVGVTALECRAGNLGQRVTLDAPDDEPLLGCCDDLVDGVAVEITNATQPLERRVRQWHFRSGLPCNEDPAHHVALAIIHVAFDLDEVRPSP